MPIQWAVLGFLLVLLIMWMGYWGLYRGKYSTADMIAFGAIAPLAMPVVFILMLAPRLRNPGSPLPSPPGVS